MISAAFFERLKPFDTIMISGAGGGFDIYSGIPLMTYLLQAGKKVVLGNFSFAMLPVSRSTKVSKTGYLITKESLDLGYFPELFLVEWLEQQGLEVPVIGFSSSGVLPLKEGYELVIDQYGVEAIVLVDGGTDSLMFGNENGLGTPSEDMTSIAAVSQLQNVPSFLAALGFGIDHFHGVCHYQVLENVSRLIQEGGFLGNHMVTGSDDGGKHFLSLVEHANNRDDMTPSIVANSIASALKGEFGNVHATHRTRGSRLFINPLMSQYWFFDLSVLASQIQYLNMISSTREQVEVREIIQSYRQVVPHKAWENMPL